jgi:hypothetical protein
MNIDSCEHCGSGAVYRGWCATCGRPSTAELANMRKRIAAAKLRKKRERCKHRKWTDPEQVGPYAGRERQTCKRCGLTLVREVA